MQIKIGPDTKRESKRFSEVNMGLMEITVLKVSRMSLSLTKSIVESFQRFSVNYFIL